LIAMFSRKLLTYLLINVAVSAVTVLLVLWGWERTKAMRVLPTPTPLPATPTASTLLPLDTPLPTERAGATTHTIAAGETLGLLAEQYNVTIDEIVIANGFSDANVILNIGQEIIIPGAGFATPAPTNPPPPAPIATATESTGAVSGQNALQIKLVQNAGNLLSETVVIVNVGSTAVELLGWQLRSEQGEVYAFPQLTLFTKGQVTLHTIAGKDSATDVYWGQSNAVWETGEIVSLYDSSGAIHTTFTIP
jgi:hypothetical protein